MIWKLKALQEYNTEIEVNITEINSRWVSARPKNYKYRSFFQKVKECYYLWIGKTESFIWSDGQ